MDSFEFNKVLGALLGALTLFVGVLVFSDILFEDHPPETPGFIVEVPEEGVVEEVAFVTPLPVLLASASIADGESFVRACASCHNFGEGEPNKVGPALYGVHDRQIAALPDFGYSDALTAKAGEPWNFENMDGFLENPRGWAPGTTMGYAGIRRETDRANVLAYLNSLSASPETLPTEEEAAVILAEAQAAFEAAQSGDGVELDEAVETEAGLADDSAEVKIEGGAAETPTPASEINPVVTGEDIAIEANEGVLTGDETEIAPEAPIIDSTSQDGAAVDVEIDQTADPVAVPAQATTPAIPNAAQPGTLANPADAVERSGAEGFSPAAAQPGPSPGVEVEDLSGAATPDAGGQPAVVEETVEAVSGADATTPAVTEAPAANVTIESAAPNVTVTTQEPKVIIVPITPTE